MRDVVEFFFHRYQRAVQMDMANKLQGKPTHFWIEADEWLEAYKKTLSKNKTQEFDKIWKNLDDEMQRERNRVDGFKK